MVYSIDFYTSYSEKIQSKIIDEKELQEFFSDNDIFIVSINDLD